MVDVCLLGTGGMLPMPKRWLTSLMVRCNGVNALIDCGEGTQIAMKEKGWSPKPIDLICITHFHGDHIGGLPGLLLSMGNADKTTPLTIVGPKGLTRVVSALCIIAPELPFEVNFIEWKEDREQMKFGPFILDAYKVNHRVPCYGYALTVPRNGAFNADKARELEIPLKYWNRLQHGEAVDGFTPDMVMGEARRGIKVSYCTDTRPVPVIAEYAAGADLMIAEGMYGEPEKFRNALEHKHMTMQESAELAALAQPKEMWYTHYSPSMMRPDIYLDELRKIFPRVKTPRDGWSIDIDYSGD